MGRWVTMTQQFLTYINSQSLISIMYAIEQKCAKKAASIESAELVLIEIWYRYQVSRWKASCRFSRTITQKWQNCSIFVFMTLLFQTLFQLVFQSLWKFIWTAWKVFVLGLSLARNFPHSNLIRRFTE